MAYVSMSSESLLDYDLLMIFSLMELVLELMSGSFCREALIFLKRWFLLEAYSDCIFILIKNNTKHKRNDYKSHFNGPLFQYNVDEIIINTLKSWAASVRNPNNYKTNTPWRLSSTMKLSMASLSTSPPKTSPESTINAYSSLPMPNQK